jgi:hypothetical protein
LNKRWHPADVESTIQLHLFPIKFGLIPLLSSNGPSP